MTHPDDGALLRHLDMELTDCEFDEVREHLTRCASCHNRLEEIQSTMNALSRADTSVRTLRQRLLPRFVAVAASILLAVAVYFTPLRAWVAEQARLRWNTGEETDVSSVHARQDAVTHQPTIGSVSFFPTNEVFVLELTSRQEEGSLTVAFGGGEMATATISGDLVDESLMVLPDRLRIVNSTTSTTTYAIVLPPSVRTIGVTIANENAVVLQPSNAQRTWTIPLEVR